MTRRYWMGGNRSYEQDRFFEASLDKDHWQPADSPEQWDTCWYTGMPDPEYFRDVGTDRTINHIPGNNALTVKSRLYQSLSTLRERAGIQDQGSGVLTDRLQFFPRVYVMPDDYHDFQQAAHDDPGRRWILKPKNAARGKGIQLVKDPASVPMDASWMVQEFLESPHTMRGRKYVLRLYVAITSVTPLRVYLYRQGFAKLASAPYDEANADNPYSYLTNPDINALNLEADVPVEFVDLDRYRAWLRERGHDDEALFDRIEDMVALTCLSALEAMRERSRAIGADTRGCYEMLGIDCLVDSDLKPWVLECNLSPSLEVCAGPESGGDIEKRVKGALVADLVSLVGLNGKADVDSSDSREQQIIAETEDELARAGNFRRLLPSRDPEAYLPLYTFPRLEDWLVSRGLAGTDLAQPTVQRHCAEDRISEDCVYLYDTRCGHLNELNETASLIWLMATDGIGPDDIADALTQSARQNAATGPDAWAIRQDVWSTLADWANGHFLAQEVGNGDPVGNRPEPESPAPPLSKPFSCVLRCGDFRVTLSTDSSLVVNRIRQLLAPLEVPAPEASASRLEIVRDIPGYTLVLDGRVEKTRVALSRVAPAILDCLASHAARDGDIIVDAGVLYLPGDADNAILIANGNPELGDDPALALAAQLNGRFGRGLRIPLSPEASPSGLGLPARMPDKHGHTDLAAISLCRHTLTTGHEVLLQPSSEGMAGRTHRINTLLIPGEVPSGEGELRPVPVTQALRYLIAGCFGPHARPLDGDSFSRLSTWLETVDRYLIDVNELDAVTDRLSLKEWGDESLPFRRGLSAG
ncbi:amylase [Marinobacter sp.]|uniref:amylase n=1 Tax=Marinobacter sp. TaxID=50741 RepID=UPI0035615023